MKEEICEKCRHCLSCMCGDEFEDCGLKDPKYINRKYIEIEIKREL